jgi:DNA ligase (NAD+)
MKYESLEHRRSIYHQAKEAYYNAAEPIIEDYEFDELENYLKENDPTFKTYVGAPSKEDKYEHWSPMLSLKKISLEPNEDGTPNNDQLKEDFSKWSKEKGNKFEISPKFDGVSINLQYENGTLIKAITRGDKEKGRDVIEKVKHLVPNEISPSPSKVEVRGEILMRVDIFEEKYSKDFKNPRNIVSGILAQKTIDVDLNDISIVPFELREYRNDTFEFWSTDELYEFFREGFDDYNPFLKDKFLFKKTFENSEDFIEFKDKMEVFRKECPYQLDGFVVKVANSEIRKELGETDTHPEWGLAVKFIPKTTETSIIDIDWRLGKSGEFTPVATLAPIELDGTTVQHATLHNLGIIRKNKTWPGARVAIEKKGDIIPQVTKIITEAAYETEYPKNCPECGSHTVIENDIRLMCSNKECEGVKKLKFVSAATKLELDYLGTKNAEKLYDTDLFSDVFDLFDMNLMNVEQLTENGFSDGKIVRKIIEGFNKVRNIDIEKVIYLMEIDNCGKRMSKVLAKYFSYNEEDFANMEKEIIKSFVEEAGLYRERLYGILVRLENYGVKVNLLERPTENGDTMKTFEMTGSPKGSGYSVKKEFLQIAEENGFQHTSLKAGTDLLITDSLSSTSSKMKKAEKLGIETITYETFKERYL